MCLEGLANLLQGVSGVGMWARSDDKEATRWSQEVRGSTQPDSAPNIISSSSSGRFSWDKRIQTHPKKKKRFENGDVLIIRNDNCLPAVLRKRSP